jgi:hypothetical protein
MSSHTHNSFTPGEIWPDADGVHINAHGGGMLYADGTYHWFGEHKVAGKAGNKATVGVSCYTSTDLYNWTNAGIALPVVHGDTNHHLAAGCILERPKVIYNRRTGKYVMWFHLELLGEGYASALCGVAIADRPTGPYTYTGCFRPDRHMSRDMTLFVDDDDDDDERAYLFCASEENRTMHISLLRDDYLGPAGRFERVFEGRSMEAPAVFKRDGRYYLIASGCTGWDPNEARSAVADSIWGPWTELGNPCVGPNAELTFGAQSTYALPVAGSPASFIFMADRWRPDDAIDGRYVWLPIEFQGQRPIIRWRDEWDLSALDAPLQRAAVQQIPPIQPRGPFRIQHIDTA